MENEAQIDEARKFLYEFNIRVQEEARETEAVKTYIYNYEEGMLIQACELTAAVPPALRKRFQEEKEILRSFSATAFLAKSEVVQGKFWSETFNRNTKISFSTILPNESGEA